MSYPIAVNPKSVYKIHNGQYDQQLPEARKKTPRTVECIDAHQHIGNVAGNAYRFENQSVPLYSFVCCKPQRYTPVLMPSKITCKSITDSS